MKKTELREVLEIVKKKLNSDVEAACGLFWPDRTVTTYYAVGEEDCNTEYAVGECDEEPVVRYGVSEM